MKNNYCFLVLTVLAGLPACAIAQNTYPPNGDVHLSDSAFLGAGHWATEGMNYAALSTFGGTLVRGNSINWGQFTIGSFSQLAPVNGLHVAGDSRFLGNVGIGTTAPRSTLHVISAGDYAGEFENSLPGANAWIKIANDRRAYLMGVRGDTRDGFVIYDNAAGTDRIYVDPNGNVGIGTTSPIAKLDVHGPVRMDYLSVLPQNAGAGEGGEIALKGTGNNVDWFLDNQGDHFRIHSAGGERVIVNAAGIVVNGKATVSTLELTSDRNQKAGFAPIDNLAILNKVSLLPIMSWHYTNSPVVQHIGPMAQDFKSAFDLGEDDKHIGAGDAIGVAFAAIQGLHEQLNEKDARIASLEKELTSMKVSVADRLTALEKSLPKNVLQASFRPEATR